MSKFKCKKCEAEFEGDYWNETLEGQIMSDNGFVPIEDAPEGLIWKCPGCMSDTEVEEVKDDDL